MNLKFQIPGALIVVFLLMLPFKLQGLINLSWLWVTAPLWIPIALPFLTGLVFCGSIACSYVINLFRTRR